MSVRLPLVAIWSLSAALLIKLLTSWSELPGRVAVHFGIDAQPNGWSSRAGLAATVLIAVLGEAVLSSWVLIRLGSEAGIAALVFLVVNLVMICVFWQMINYNTRGTPFRFRWVLLPLIALLGGVAGVVMTQASNYRRH